MLIADQQRLVIGDQFATQGQGKQSAEQPQRPPAAAIAAKAFQATTGQRRKAAHHAFLALKSILGSTSV